MGKLRSRGTTHPSAEMYQIEEGGRGCKATYAKMGDHPICESMRLTGL